VFSVQAKTRKFVKNTVIATIGAVAGGWLGAELSDLLTDSAGIISASSVVGEYALAFGTFIPLHTHDNQDLYRDEKGGFRWRPFAADMAKFTGGASVLDYIYVMSRSAVTYFLIKKGFEPGTASIAAQGVCIPPYLLALTYSMKKFGVIREEPPSTT
jgi:hypothetical protein